MSLFSFEKNGKLFSFELKQIKEYNEQKTARTVCSYITGSSNKSEEIEALLVSLFDTAFLAYDD